MDVVIQFAIQKLGFQLSDIVIYAWSIGGFTGAQRLLDHTEQPVWDELLRPGMVPSPCFQRLAFAVIFLATWAVMSYPEIKAVVLDASFDDLLPLAFKVMPDSWSESNRDL